MRISQKLSVLLVPVVFLAMFVFASPAMAGFGLERFAFGATNQNGSPDTQAGSHPYALTNTFVLNQPQFIEVKPGRFGNVLQGDLRDVRLELPPGFVGDPNATPRCSYQEFVKSHPIPGSIVNECPNETAIGISTTFNATTLGTALFDVSDPVYNLVPPTGVAAEFGFLVAGITPVFLDTSVRTGGDYGLTTSVSDINQAIAVDGSKVTIWGVPADPVHNDVRGTCLDGEPAKVETNIDGLEPGEEERESTIIPAADTEVSGEVISLGECPTQTPLLPLLTNPTSCGEPRTATLSVDSWEEPGLFHSKSRAMPELAGCEKLDFSPTIGVKPDGTAGSTPTGLNVDLHVPQETTENPVGLAEADVKNTTVTLPAGVQLSPSAADGLQACSNAQIGFERYEELDNSGRQTPIFKEKVYNPTTQKEEATLCPDASKIANVKIKTPLLEGELEGSVYLAAPQNFTGLPENPFSSLIAMYLVAEEPKAGVLVKLPGKVSLNEATGQITTTFENTPQLPFSDLKLEFFGTDRAPLATPARCGAYGTEASFTPWAGDEPIGVSSKPFEITSGPEVQTASGVGGPSSTPCPGAALPFAPSLQSGTTNINAGSFSNLTTTLSREDGQQNIQSVTLHYPPGLSGLLSGVELCPEAQANAGSCGPNSQVGETIVSVGLGGDPFSVTGGKVYLTGPYDGAPFGLSIVNPAKAGPFDLQEGRPVVVRAKIEVNPLNAALTVTTNTPAEGYAIPSIIEGIPLQIKHVNVNITRPGFAFNPTDCNPAAVTGTIDSAEGASSPVSIPFQVTNCASLRFEPKFAVSTSGKTSRTNGASLHVNLTYPSESMGKDANIAKVKVELPKQLPSRLTTLQKACTAAQFHANPAGCPAASLVGHAKAITPLVPVALEGPAYFVSNGNEAFPNLIVVLQGYGVTIDLVGDTFISKAGVTSSTFKTVPDAPVGSFELTLPEGRYSALTADGSLCKAKKSLVMPSEFAGQNGAVIKQATKIGVTGCPKGKRASKKRNGKKAKRPKK
jgi:hypothetical protein